MSIMDRAWGRVGALNKNTDGNVLVGFLMSVMFVGLLGLNALIPVAVSFVFLPLVFRADYRESVQALYIGIIAGVVAAIPGLTLAVMTMS